MSNEEEEAPVISRTLSEEYKEGASKYDEATLQRWQGLLLEAQEMFKGAKCAPDTNKKTMYSRAAEAILEAVALRPDFRRPLGLLEDVLQRLAELAEPSEFYVVVCAADARHQCSGLYRYAGSRNSRPSYIRGDADSLYFEDEWQLEVGGALRYSKVHRAFQKYPPECDWQSEIIGDPPCSVRLVPGQALSAAAEPDRAQAEENYPHTPYLPKDFSPGQPKEEKQRKGEDSVLTCCQHLTQVEVVVTEKLDGGNCCIKKTAGVVEVYARSHSSPTKHQWFCKVKDMVMEFSAEQIEILGDMALYGENMFRVHSQRYGNLTNFFCLFGVRDRQEDRWLSWDEVVEVAAIFGMDTVPVVFRGVFVSTDQLSRNLTNWAAENSQFGSAALPEGFVVRHTPSFPNSEFGKHIAKRVRANFNQLDETTKEFTDDQKCDLGPPLPARPRLLA